jgi:TRAP-type C4-dicarboxylate transport system permease small subunit
MSFWVKPGQLVTKIAGLVAIVALLIMMAIVVINVIGRGLFVSPILGTIEIVGLAGVFMISFAIGLAERDRAHVTVLIIVSRLPQWLQSLFAVVGFFLCLGVVVILFWAGVLQFWEAFTPGFETQALRVPKPPFVIVWLCGCVFLFGFLLKHFIEELVRIRKK